MNRVGEMALYFLDQFQEFVDVFEQDFIIPLFEFDQGVVIGADPVFNLNVWFGNVFSISLGENEIRNGC